MKNTRFLQPHKAPGRLPVRAVHLLLVLVALSLAWLAPGLLQTSVLSITTPLWKVRTALAQGVNAAKERLMTRSELQADNTRLREENARLSIQGALYDELSANVRRLESLLGRAPEGGTYVLAHVLASPSASPYDSFLIDRGTAEGIAIGSRVLFDDTVALGTIDLTAEHSARVSLYSSPGMTHEVYVGTTSARVEAVGQGGGMFIIKAPKELSITLSDAVMIAGTQEAIGFVREIESGDSDAFQTIYAAMPINLFETREVLVRRAYVTTP